MKRAIGLIPPLIWTGFVAFLSLTDSSSLPANSWFDKIHADKIVHAVLYAIMFLFYFRALKKMGFSNNVIALSSIMTISIGIVIEVLQRTLYTGRYFDLLDIMANIAGVLITASIIKK